MTARVLAAGVLLCSGGCSIVFGDAEYYGGSTSQSTSDGTGAGGSASSGGGSNPSVIAADVFVVGGYHDVLGQPEGTFDAWRGEIDADGSVRAWLHVAPLNTTGRFVAAASSTGLRAYGFSSLSLGVEDAQNVRGYSLELGMPAAQWSLVASHLLAFSQTDSCVPPGPAALNAQLLFVFADCTVPARGAFVFEVNETTGAIGALKALKKPSLVGPTSSFTFVGDELYGVGGDNTPSAVAHITLGTDTVFSETTSLPDPVPLAGLCSDGRRLYVAGGPNRKVYWADGEAAGALGDWSSTADVPIAADGPACFFHGGRGYFFGGLEDDGDDAPLTVTSGTHEGGAFVPDTLEHAPIPYPRGQMHAVVVPRP